MLKFNYGRPRPGVPDCSVFAFFGEGVSDVGSACKVDGRHLAVSYFSGRCAYGARPGLSGVLLRDSDVKNGPDRAPLARYAAEHWVAHAQVENVASRVRDGMEYLFDLDKLYFEAWVTLHNVDPYFRNLPDSEPGARPLYYAALCGFHELVEHLTLEYPQSASARGGLRGTALYSASFAGHLQIVRSLLRHGMGVDVRGFLNKTPLQYASESGHRDVVQCLLDHGADVNSQENDRSTPLNGAAHGGQFDVVRVLLEHNADVHSRDEVDSTPARRNMGL